MNWTRTGLLVLAALIVLGPSILDRELMPPDEPRFGLVSKQMYEDQDWVVTRRGVDVYTDKPPLLFWTAAVGFSLLGGPAEAATRFGPLLGTLILVGLTHRFGLRWFGEPVASYGTMVLVSCSMLLQKGAWMATDPLLAAAAFGLVCCLDTRLEQASVDWGRWSWIAGACLGLGMLAKGPVVGIPVLFALLAGRLTERPFLSARRLFSLGVMVGFLGLTVPWVVALLTRMQPAVLFAEVFRQNVGRYVSSWDNYEAWWYYAEALTTGLFPWSLLVIVVLPFVARTALADERVRTLVLWVGMVILFFSIPSGKRGVYLLPIYPVLALLVAHALEQSMRSKARFAVVAMGAGAGGLVFATGLGLLGSFERAVRLLPESLAALDDVRVGAGFVFTSFGAGLLAAATAALMRRTKWMFAGPFVAALLLGCGFYFFVRPAINEAQQARLFGASVQRAVGDAPVGYCRRKWELVSWYADRIGPWFDTHEEQLAFLQTRSSSALVCATEDLPPRQAWPDDAQIVEIGRVGRLEMSVLKRLGAQN